MDIKQETQKSRITLKKNLCSVELKSDVTGCDMKATYTLSSEYMGQVQYIMKREAKSCDGLSAQQACCFVLVACPTWSSYC